MHTKIKNILLLYDNLKKEEIKLFSELKTVIDEIAGQKGPSGSETALSAKNGNQVKYVVKYDDGDIQKEVTINAIIRIKDNEDMAPVYFLKGQNSGSELSIPLWKVKDATPVLEFLSDCL